MAKPQPVYEVHRAASKQRAKNLQSYLTENVWGPSSRRLWADFICKTRDDCRTSAMARQANFFEAQGHAVGDCFDLSTADGLPFRVLVVPMEAGGGETFADVARRTQCVRDSGRLPFQSTPSSKGRNPHMKGTTVALRLALGLPLADAHGDPFVERTITRLDAA